MQPRRRGRGRRPPGTCQEKREHNVGREQGIKGAHDIDCYVTQAQWGDTDGV